MLLLQRRITVPLAVCVTAVALSLNSCTISPQPAEDPDGFANYVAGRAASQRSDVDAAVSYYFKALEKSPGNYVILQEMFSLTLSAGQFDDALKVAEEISSHGVVNSVASMLLTLDSFKRGDFDQVGRRLAGARGMGFETLMAPLVKAWAEAARNQTDLALDALEPLAKNPAFDSFEKEHRALILDYGKRFADAETSYKELIEGGALTSVQPILSYGAMLERQRRSADASELYIHSLEEFGENRFLREALEGLADDELQLVPTATPEGALSNALLRAATELSQDNAIAPAIIYARLASFLSPDVDEISMLLGNLFFAREEYQTAMRAYGQVDSEAELIKLARVRTAFAHDSSGEEALAQEVLATYLEEFSDDIDALAASGDLYRGHSDFEASLVRYDLAIGKIEMPERSHWFLYFTRGIVNEELDKWDQAEADFLTALELFPDEPQVLNYLGYSWIDRGMNIQRAKEMIEKSVEQRPNDGFIIDSKGWVQFLLGDYEEAVKSLERAILLEPDDATINEHLGDAYWMVGRKLEARFQWSHAMAIGPDDGKEQLVRDKIDFGLEFAKSAHAND